MAHYTQKMINSHGQVRFAPIGFSWTTLLFGFFVPLLRGDFIWFLVMFLLTAFFPFIVNIIFAFIYNGIYYKSLLNNGYVPDDGSYVRVSHTAIVQPIPTIIINNTAMATIDNYTNDNSSNDNSSNDTNYPGPM